MEKEIVKEDIIEKDKTKEGLAGTSYMSAPSDNYMECLTKIIETAKKSIEAEEIDKKILALQSQINTLTTELLCQKAKIEVLQSVIGK